MPGLLTLESQLGTFQDSTLKSQTPYWQENILPRPEMEPRLNGARKMDWLVKWTVAMPDNLPSTKVPFTFLTSFSFEQNESAE